MADIGVKEENIKIQQIFGGSSNINKRDSSKYNKVREGQYFDFICQNYMGFQTYRGKTLSKELLLLRFSY